MGGLLHFALAERGGKPTWDTKSGANLQILMGYRYPGEG